MVIIDYKNKFVTNNPYAKPIPYTYYEDDTYKPIKNPKMFDKPETVKFAGMTWKLTLVSGHLYYTIENNKGFNNIYTMDFKNFYIGDYFSIRGSLQEYFRLHGNIHIVRDTIIFVNARGEKTAVKIPKNLKIKRERVDYITISNDEHSITASAYDEPMEVTMAIALLASSIKPAEPRKITRIYSKYRGDWIEVIKKLLSTADKINMKKSPIKILKEDDYYKIILPQGVITVKNTNVPEKYRKTINSFISKLFNRATGNVIIDGEKSVFIPESQTPNIYILKTQGGRIFFGPEDRYEIGHTRYKGDYGFISIYVDNFPVSFLRKEATYGMDLKDYVFEPDKYNDDNTLEYRVLDFNGLELPVQTRVYKTGIYYIVTAPEYIEKPTIAYPVFEWGFKDVHHIKVINRHRIRLFDKYDRFIELELNSKTLYDSNAKKIPSDIWTRFDSLEELIDFLSF